LDSLGRLRVFCLIVSPLVLATGTRPARAQQPAESTTAGGPAEGPPSPAARALDAEVDRLATRGQRLLDRGQTQEAIASFRRAYELRADAGFLYDIAECYRQLGSTEQALHFYRRYLSVAPDAADREEVEAQIAALEKKKAAVPPAIAPSFANDVVVVPVEPPRPLWKRWWLWAALGAAVAGGTALALTLGRGGTDVPPTALGDKTFY
jgi:tetratricopeptide (TPR) repeat protein